MQILKCEKMDKTIVNGKEIVVKPTKSTFGKTAFQISREIYSDLGRIGITEEYIDLNLPRNTLIRNTLAEISWYVNEKNFYFSCSTQNRYVDNLGVIGKVISQESYAIRNGLKSFGQVMNQFKLDYDPNGEKTRTPREIMGVDENNKDLDYITFKYRGRAKEIHPDIIKGDDNKMKELNEAYEIIKKEFEHD